MFAQRCSESEIVERGRAQLARECLDLARNALRELLDLGHTLLNDGVIGSATQRAQLECEAGDELPHLVVQLTREMTPLLLCGARELSQHIIALLIRAPALGDIGEEAGATQRLAVRIEGE